MTDRMMSEVLVPNSVIDWYRHWFIW